MGIIGKCNILIMDAKYISLALVVSLLLNCFTAEAIFFGGGRGRGRGYRRGGGYGRRGGGRGNFGAGLAGVIGTAAVLKGAFLLGGALATGKKKRSADDLYDDMEVEKQNVYDEAMNYFDLAMEMDEDTCIQRTLCEIMSTTQTQKNPSTIYKIINTIYSQNSPVMVDPSHDEGVALLMAGYFGKTNKSREVCTDAFKLCNKDSETMVKQMEEELEVVQKYAAQRQ